VGLHIEFAVSSGVQESRASIVSVHSVWLTISHGRTKLQRRKQRMQQTLQRER
jgi:hypothetical protein